MHFERLETYIPGCFELTPRKINDERGCFVKTYHFDAFKEHGLDTDWREEYYSVSHKGVLRGLHYQSPPHDHAKLVYCTSGEVLDVVVDLRVGSPMFGKFTIFQLTACKANMIYIPRGCAHGFYTISDSATMMYKVTSVYAPSNDTGIHWNSVGISWPDTKPIVSLRDNSLIFFSDFISPFAWGRK